MQYVRYVGNALRGDFGVPFQSPTETVMELIGRTWPVSIRLGLVTLAFAIPLGLLAGILAATWQNSWIDYSATFISTLGLTVPNFVIGVLADFAAGRALQGAAHRRLGASRSHYIMPAIALGAAPLALTARYTRTSLLEVKRADYIRTAQAKGLSPLRVLTRHKPQKRPDSTAHDSWSSSAHT